MSLRNPKYTTVSAPRSKRVHAVSLARPTYTLCDRKFSGWRVGISDAMNCSDCKLAILKARVRPKK